MNHCIVNRTGAIDALRSLHYAEVFAEHLRERPEALRAGDHDIRPASMVVSVPRNPDRGQCARAVRGGHLGAYHGLHHPEQNSWMGGLFIESVGSNSGWYTVTGKCAAHSDHLNRWKAAPNDRQQ